jgi:2-polyprenyl-3-methyl-5-hydroxy-6-metoxy-1,4-benzoquinol methylase
MIEQHYTVDLNANLLPDKYRLVLDSVGRLHRVLELGCYNGFFSRKLVENNNIVYGVDFDKEALCEAAKICECTLLCDLDQPECLFELPGRPFDVILMMDVIEHLKRPESLLRVARKLLSPSGVAIVTLPNIAFWGIRKLLLLGRFEYKDFGILDRTHLHFYTFSTARQLLEGEGYKLIRWEPLSYITPVVGRLGLRRVPSVKGILKRVEHKLAQRNPNFFCMQFFFLLGVP